MTKYLHLGADELAPRNAAAAMVLGASFPDKALQGVGADLFRRPFPPPFCSREGIDILLPAAGHWQELLRGVHRCAPATTLSECV